MSNNKSLKYALIGAACAAGAGALGYFLLFKNNSQGYVPKKNVRNLSKASTIKVLKQLKKELFASFQTMSMFAQQIKMQARGRATEAEVKQFVCEHPQISQGLKAGEDKAYKKCNVTEDEFRNAVENLFKDDKDIQAHRTEIKNMFDKAAMGVQLDIKTEIPQSLTSQNTVQILEKIMKETCKKMQEVFIQIVEDGGVVNMNDPQTIQALNQIKIDDVKQRILEEHGLEQYDDSGDKILSYATQKYGKDNVDGFQEKMMDLEMKQRKSMELIQQNPKDLSIIDKTFSEASQVPAMGAGMGQGMGFGIGKRTQRGEKVVRDEEPKKEEEEPKKEEDKAAPTTTEEPKEQQQEEEQLPELKEQEQEQQNTQENEVQSEKQPVSEKPVSEQQPESEKQQEEQQQVEEEVQEQQQEQQQQEEPVAEQEQEQEQEQVEEQQSQKEQVDYSIIKGEEQQQEQQQQQEEEVQQQEEQQQQE